MKYFLAIIISCFLLSALAQDTIYFRNNSIIIGVVKEVNPTEVKYKLFSNPSGPLYTVFKNTIAKISYKEGSSDTFVFVPDKNNIPVETTQTITPVPPYKKKNVILYNPMKLADGVLGLSYMHILYKKRLNILASAAIPYGGTSNFSNGILLEQNQNYYLYKMNMDFSLGANYNLSKDRKFFPFIGVLGRLAQFEGKAYDQPFILNKYYFYGNVGFIARSAGGFSFMMNLALGHYYNNYLSNNPIAIMNKNYVIQPRNGGISSFIFSMQFGYSF